MKSNKNDVVAYMSHSRCGYLNALARLSGESQKYTKMCCLHPAGIHNLKSN